MLQRIVPTLARASATSISRPLLPTLTQPTIRPFSAAASHDSHGHGHGHASAGEPKKYDPRLEEAWFLGQDPTKPRVKQGWETAAYWGYGLFFAGVFVFWQWGPNTSLQQWAREEAWHTGFRPPAPAPDLVDEPQKKE